MLYVTIRHKPLDQKRFDYITFTGKWRKKSENDARRIECIEYHTIRPCRGTVFFLLSKIAVKLYMARGDNINDTAVYIMR